MKKIVKILGTCIILLCLVWLGTLIADRQNLRNNLIRLHVVAASDSEEDQRLKLQVRDAVIENLQTEMNTFSDAAAAQEYLKEQLPQIKEIAEDVLETAGVEDAVTVTLGEECFPTRRYDTFSLPAGVYESLKITIGKGQGQNWWCVVFPSLCLPATSDGFADTAAGAGFPDSLAGALQNDGGYEIRFFLLDCLGWLENLFHT